MSAEDNNDNLSELKRKTLKLVKFEEPLGISDIRLARRIADLGATVSESHEVIDSLIAEGSIERDSLNYLTSVS